MRVAILVLGLMAVATLGYRNEDIVNQINADPTSTWTAGHNENFEGMSLEAIKMLMGTKPSGSPMRVRGAVADAMEEADSTSSSLPASFDSRTQWPSCDSIGFIRNQADCGSCWAFGATEAFTDRWCIASGQTENPIMSPMWLMTCSRANDGCEGGEPSSAWQFIKDEGMVTSTCQPYTIPTCPPSSQPCLSFVPTPPCSDSCVNSTGNFSDKYYVSDAYQVGGFFKNSALDMQKELVANGPVEAAFTVYEDFVNYKSGVYIHKTGAMLGGHAVKIIGYGVENGTDYWEVANSWTTYWGADGFFRILRGHDECGIESDVWAGTPKTN